MYDWLRRNTWRQQTHASKHRQQMQQRSLHSADICTDSDTTRFHGADHLHRLIHVCSLRLAVSCLHHRNRKPDCDLEVIHYPEIILMFRRPSVAGAVLLKSSCENSQSAQTSEDRIVSNSFDPSAAHGWFQRPCLMEKEIMWRWSSFSTMCSSRPPNHFS